MSDITTYTVKISDYIQNKCKEKGGCEGIGGDGGKRMSIQNRKNSNFGFRFPSKEMIFEILHEPGRVIITFVSVPSGTKILGSSTYIYRNVNVNVTLHNVQTKQKIKRK